MTYGARLFQIILFFQFLEANPIHLEFSIIPQIDSQNLNGNKYEDFIAFNNSVSPRTIYHIENRGSDIKILWQYTMPENISGYFTYMILDDFDNNDVIELIVAAYQDGKKEIFYIFSIDERGSIKATPQLARVNNSSLLISQPRKLYPMPINSDGNRFFILTQGSPNRIVMICEYVDGQINSVGTLGGDFLKQSIGPLEISIGNFDNDNVEDVFILSNDINPQGVIIFSNGEKKSVDLKNYPHLKMLYSKGKDVNFDGLDDLIMISKNGDLLSNIWGEKSITLSDSSIEKILVNLDDGLINLNSVNKLGKIREITLDPLSLKMLNSEYTIPVFVDSNITLVHSLITPNNTLLINNSKSEFIELWSKSRIASDTKESLSNQRFSNETPDYVINVGSTFIHHIERDENKSFLQFIENLLPIGMEFNLNEIRLEWTPDSTQLGFHDFSYLLEMREKAGVEMSMEEEIKLVNQMENIIEETHNYLIYVNDPIKFNSKQNYIKIANTQFFEWEIDLSDNNNNAVITVGMYKGEEESVFELIEPLPINQFNDSTIVELDKIILSDSLDNHTNDISDIIKNTNKAKFHWTPNTNKDSVQFILTVSDGYGSDTLDFFARIHPEIDLSMNQTEFTGTVNQTINIPIELNQSPLASKYTYELVRPPENMRISENGVINWIPLPTQVDNYFFNVQVFDGFATFDLEYKIYINAIPVISSRPSELFFINLMDSLSFALESFDMNSDAVLNWKLISGPGDMVLNSNGILKWKASLIDHNPYQIQLSDGIDSAEWKGSIYVNTPPIITSKPDTIISENHVYKYSINVVDSNIISPFNPDSSNLITYELIKGALGMEINNGVLWWEKNNKASEEYLVSIKVSDGIDEIFQNYKLLVNSSPVIVSTDSISLMLGDSLNFFITATDLNLDDSLLFFIDTLKSGMNLNNNSGLINWIPTKADFGKHKFNLQVKDGYDVSNAKQELLIFVYDLPQFTGDMPVEAFIGLEYAGFITGLDMYGEKLRDKNSIIIENTTIPKYELSEYGRYFQWTPTKLDIGRHEINIKIIDNNGIMTNHIHNISVFDNPCAKCDSEPVNSPADSTDQ